MNRYRLLFYPFFLFGLCAAGAVLLWLCSRFEGFAHPLTPPLLLGGIVCGAGALYLLLP